MDGGRTGWGLVCAALICVASMVAPVRSASSVEIPALSSNVDLVATFPDIAGISAAFDPKRPLMYVSTMHGLDVYDISDPPLPILAGVVPMAMFQNENVNLGAAARRPDGTSFVLMGTDLVGAVTPSQPGMTAIEPGDSIYVQHLYVIDVTDPAAPFLRSDLETTTYTHTISCLDPSCRYAYTAGTDERFSVIDLSDLDRPREAKRVGDRWGWHDWHVDAAGVVWKSAMRGTAAFDVSDPLRPRVLNTTNAKAASAGTWNNFIHHNVERPFGRRFPPGSVREPGGASVHRGDVLLVTEEELNTGPCADEAAFQTWEIPSLRDGDNPTNTPGHGTIKPLDQWRSTFYGADMDSPVGTQCSAHYFDFHQYGFVAQAWYDHGIRILDVRDARNIKEVGYFVAQAQEAWSAYWVPKRDSRDRVFPGSDGTPARSTLVYSVDAVRGLDILRVTLPTSTPAATSAVRPPPLPAWLDTPVATSSRADRFTPAFSCRVL